MQDATKVIAGLVIFAALVSFPFWFNAAAGGSKARPQVELPSGPDQAKCVESKDYMAGRHMELLDRWRDAVVRDGQRVYVSREHGTKHEMSLTKTCLGCHRSREKFCNRCHDYTGVSPYCFDCHVEPEGSK